MSSCTVCVVKVVRGTQKNHTNLPWNLYYSVIENVLRELLKPIIMAKNTGAEYICMSIISSKVIIFIYLLAPQEVFLVVLLFFYTTWRDNFLIFTFKIYDNSGTSPVFLWLNDHSNKMTQHAWVVHLSAVCSVFTRFCSLKSKLGPFVYYMYVLPHKTIISC